MQLFTLFFCLTKTVDERPQGPRSRHPADRNAALHERQQWGSCTAASRRPGKVGYGPFAPHLVEGRTAALSALLSSAKSTAEVSFGSKDDLHRIGLGKHCPVRHQIGLLG
jgi:hypothetical protein